ncbi:MAG: Dot/Icm T4SS effector AnkH/LegA3 [Gammaproteobacteria bacterium]
MLTLAQAIIKGDRALVESLLQSDEEGVNDLDEYGFTPLIETVIMDHIGLAEYLLAQGADIEQGDVSGRTALHWASDLDRLAFCQLFIKHNADPNAYNRGGQSILVNPLLRRQEPIKQLLTQHGAKLSFAQDFINTKLLGHRYQLHGDVDIVNANGDFIELDFEGFILEFSLDVIYDSLQRYKNHFAARDLRPHFQYLDKIINAFSTASQLLKYQENVRDLASYEYPINQLLQRELLLLPVAYRGHAVTFIKCGHFLAKCDRGENSKREGTVNIYLINNMKALDNNFLKSMIFKRQSQKFIHHYINSELDLQPIGQLPLSAQISGNCSWANVEAAVPTAYLLALLNEQEINSVYENYEDLVKQVFALYQHWLAWDQDRTLYDCIQSFYQSDPAAKASKASILAAVLFQSCDYRNPEDLIRAEKILAVLTEPDYRYVLDNYIQTYCVRRLTVKGNNLLHILDDHGIPVPQGLHKYPIK